MQIAVQDGRHGLVVLAATAEGVLAYRFRARLEADEPTLRLGLKGTAKIYGPPRLLALWLFRRPIAMVRQWLAF